MKKRIVSLFLCFVMLFSVAFANTSMAEEPKGSEFNAANLQLFKQLIQNLFYEEVTDRELYEAALKGMFQSLDSYSNYYNEEESTEFNTDVSGNYSGIGIKFDGYNNYMRVVKVFTKSPAYTVGLKAGDYVVEINGEDVGGWTTSKAASYIRGETGTTVKLSILRDNKVFEVEIERADIQAESCDFDILDEDIGYIKIEEFNLSTAQEVERYLHALKIIGYDKLILDLRDNAGGYVDQSVLVAKNFVPKGVITTLKYKNSNQDNVYMSYLQENPFKMVVLVNENTASSSEILAGALKDNGVKLVGETTYGKGVFQSVYNLKDGGSIKITRGKYFTPSGVCIDKVGITPDFVVEGEEEQLKKAIEEVNKL